MVVRSTCPRCGQEMAAQLGSLYCANCSTTLARDAGEPSSHPTSAAPTEPGAYARDSAALPSPTQTRANANVWTSAPFSPESRYGQLGALVAEHPGSQGRYIWVVLWGALAIWCVVGNLFQGSFGGVLLGLALGAGCYAYYYYYVRLPFHAEVFVQGFAITRGGKTTSVRWEDVANVEHAVRTVRYDFVIPLYRSHSYVITLSTGRRVKVTSSFSKHRELGETIKRVWTEAAIDRRAQVIAQRYVADQDTHLGR